jgi:serine/threonine-protein kinase HipA
MLKVYVNQQLAGSLFKPETEPSKTHFGYDEACPRADAVSLSMPVTREHYISDHKALHPIFDMNLPEGALADRLRKEFSKVIPNFDALALLKIVGKSQVGRLRFAIPGEGMVDVPAENLNQLLAHDGAEGLFESLLSRYAVHSGISGAMPKVMVRGMELAYAQDGTPSRVTHRGATHIVKAWTDEYPRLAENEYFCMRAAMHAKLEVPKFELSKGGKFLVVDRFDIHGDHYLGFEDFCVLNGKTANQKYDGSYENIAKRINDFVSPQLVRPALESFFKALALSCTLKNGDAHLKNFGVLYDSAESDVRLSPIYDLVTTTVYKPSDVLALTLAGSKRWPQEKALVAFARTSCNVTEGRARALLEEVAQGVLLAADEAVRYMQHNTPFQAVGAAMLREWNKGLAPGA